MRAVLLSSAILLFLSVCAFLGARAPGETARVRLRLLDADTGVAVGGLVRVRSEGKLVDPPGLYNRFQSLKLPESASPWWIVPAAGCDTELPRAPVQIEAISGLESGLARVEIDLASKPTEIAIKLPTVFAPERRGLVAGNTHLHLRNLTPEQADEYLRAIPAADRLKVLFLSYLERHKDDETYVTNRYPVGDLEDFKTTGVLVNNGEEHRHNFQPYGQGYGHVMFLGIRSLVRPVSLGPGITAGGNDDRPLRPGLEEARRQGGTVLWCHNTNGFEDVPSALAGLFDALNVFDGSRSGTYEENYYRYLNVGLRAPISTGTDWFLYDFARVYAKAAGQLTIRSWLDAIKAGRCQATNGPLLSVTVDGAEPGDVVRLEGPRTARVEVSGVGRHDFGRLQLVQNGRVLSEKVAQQDGPAFAARMQREVAIDGPCWFAARIDATTKNEMGALLYAHTSPVYVDVGGRRVFDVEAARGLLRQLEEGEAEIAARGTFTTPAAKESVLALYRQSARDLRERVNQRLK